MFGFKKQVTKNLQYLRDSVRDHGNRISNLEKTRLSVFVDHEKGGQVYSLDFGVTYPVMEEVHPVIGGAGGGVCISGLALRGLRPGQVVSVGVDFEKVAPKLQQVGQWTFHKDRAPKCDYVMRNADGSFRFFKKAEVPADTEVTAAGKAIKSSKKRK